MNHDQVQALNYCAHAIDDLRKTITVYRKVGAHESAQVLRGIIMMLQNSVKFILPNCCSLIDPAGMRQAHFDLTRLPFPCVAFEAPWEKEEIGPDQVGDYVQTPATKRIALCWEALPEYELLPGMNSVAQHFPGGGAFVLPIYWGPKEKKWTVVMGGVFVPYENKLQDLEPTEMLPASRAAYNATLETGHVKENAKIGRVEPFYLLPELFGHAVSTYGSREKAYGQIIMDAQDEAWVLVQACSVINCANVEPADLPAPLALNRKRRARNKQPFFIYKILQLSEESRRVQRVGGTGEQHASPRMHLRRGHLRRLEDKVVWVRPTMVNAGSQHGAVLKDYAVRPPR